MKQQGIHKNIPVSDTNLQLGVRVGFISSHFETILFPQDVTQDIYVTLEYNTYIDRSNMKCGPI